MKKRNIDAFNHSNPPEPEDDEVLKQLLRAHFDQENREKWTQALGEMGIQKELKITPRKWVRWVAAAAILAFVAGMAFWKWNTTPEALALQYIRNDAPIMLPSNFRGTAEHNTTRYTKALDLYEQKRYSEALEILNTANTAVTAPAEQLLHGICHLYTGDYHNAIEVFSAANILDPVMKNQADWFLALAYIQNNNSTKAIPLLQTLANNNGTAQSVQARNLLEKLK